MFRSPEGILVGQGCRTARVTWVTLKHWMVYFLDPAKIKAIGLPRTCIFAHVCIYKHTLYTYIYTYIYIHTYIYIYTLNFTSSWDFVIFREFGYQGQDAIFGAVYAHKGGTKQLKRHGLHGFALDQPSINGIGPITVIVQKK